MSIKFTFNQLLTFALSLLLIVLAGTVKAESRLYPGFLFIESAYLEQGSDANSAEAFFTLTNLHPDDPLVLLTVSSDIFEAATFEDAENSPLSQIVIQPGERLEGVRVVLAGVNLSESSHSMVDFNVLIRRGLEPLPPVDAIESSGGLFSGGIKAREAGIPNEDEYIFRVDIRN